MVKVYSPVTRLLYHMLVFLARGLEHVCVRLAGAWLWRQRRCMLRYCNCLAGFSGSLNSLTSYASSGLEEPSSSKYLSFSTRRSSAQKKKSTGAAPASPPLINCEDTAGLLASGGRGAAGPRKHSCLLLLFASFAGKKQQQRDVSWRAQPSKPPSLQFASRMLRNPTGFSSSLQTIASGVIIPELLFKGCLKSTTSGGSGRRPSENSFPTRSAVA
jgi:hypothetical protein